MAEIIEKDTRMDKELDQREVEERAKQFLSRYRQLCVEYGMELSNKPAEWVIIEKSYEGKREKSNT